MGLNGSNFIKACYGNNDGQIPVWIMRQAGRYLPEYRAVREKRSFNELCRSPELIAEVVSQPIERFGFDAAILFSDILTMLEPLGAPVSFPDGGPRLERPIDSPELVDNLHPFDVRKKLDFALEGIRKCKARLPNTPLIGFAGSPFTVFCYLVEGGGSKNFDKAKRFVHEFPDAARKLLGMLTDHIAEYLKAQIEAGADAVQLFDSWGGILSSKDYRQWSAKYIGEIFSHVKTAAVPRILFVNNVAPYLNIVNEIDCEVIGVDYRINLQMAAEALPGKAIQGNLDPSVLFGSTKEVARRSLEILNSVENHNRLIFNLGHGIQPGTPVESVTAVVETVHNFR